MKQSLILLILACFTLTLAGIDDADARRFGGGASFGKQRMIQPHVQQRAMPQKQVAGSPRGAARGGMMGALAGLAMGGLLGAMLFGGAFEGINLLDILVLGGILVLIVALLRRRTANAGPQPAFAGAPQGGNAMPETVASAGQAVRPKIDERHFLDAAKQIYLRMQKDWDHGDIDDIRRFCTPEIAERIASEMQPGITHDTEVAMLDARIADAWLEEDVEWVAVHFTAMLREKTIDRHGHTTENRSAEVNEIWIFRHDPRADDPTWYLAGIQQAG